MIPSLHALAVINRLLTLFQRHVGFLPRWLATFIATATSGLAHVIDRPNVIHLHLKDRFDRGFDLRLGRSAINSEAEQLPLVLRFFLSNQSLLSDHWRLNDVPDCSHR